MLMLVALQGHETTCTAMHRPYVTWAQRSCRAWRIRKGEPKPGGKPGKSRVLPITNRQHQPEGIHATNLQAGTPSIPTDE